MKNNDYCGNDTTTNDKFIQSKTQTNNLLNLRMQIPGTFIDNVPLMAFCKIIADVFTIFFHNFKRLLIISGVILVKATFQDHPITFSPFLIQLLSSKET